MKFDSFDFDVCVIGSGASGSVAAQEIASQGLRVLVLEEGRQLNPGEYLSALENAWENALVPTAGGTLQPFARPWSASALGGGMSLYAGISFRLREVDMDARAHVAPDALDPSWPISYDELRPYYDRMERCIGVARETGADPLEPPGIPAVMPAYPLSAHGRQIADLGLRRGMKPFPTPLAINTVPYAGRPACVSCGPCNEYVCPTGARASATSFLLDASIPDGALTVERRAKALRIVLADRHRAGAVEWLDLATRTRRTTRVRSIVLAANAIQSAALLLRSAQPGAPQGLGNSTGMVGRGLSYKVSGYVGGTVDADGVEIEGETESGPFSTVAFSDHYLDPDAPSGLGGVFYDAREGNWAPRNGRMRLRIHFLAGDQPMHRNVVRLARTRGAFDLPRIVVDYSTHPLDKRRLGYLSRRAGEMLTEAGADDICFEESNYQIGNRHLHGGCRAGNDPATSVVDAAGRVHDLDNVHVVDGGYFPYSAGVNPTFTIQANALRIAGGIAAGLGATRSAHSAAVPTP
ncbi:GMC oxidoreductase [Streptomyces sp. NPDC091279]|uniref:GMC oxidoreductase n=1 Tax=unclassified Streptomyces TaxID=2593676 RepID=UPI003829E93E